MNSLFALPEYFLIEESSATSAGNNEWFVRELLPELKLQAKQEGRNVYDMMDEWVESIAPSEFVPIFLPFTMASNVHPNAKGSFIGISYSHKRKHLVRSVFEGITFSHRYHLEKLLATREEPPKAIRLSGGAAKAKVWVQMFADVMQLPVETLSANENGALGCAIAAAKATGEYKDLSEAVSHMSRISDAVMPNPAMKDIYDRKYRLYVHAIESLDSFWDGMQSLIEFSNCEKAYS